MIIVYTSLQLQISVAFPTAPSFSEFDAFCDLPSRIATSARIAIRRAAAWTIRPLRTASVRMGGRLCGLASWLDAGMAAGSGHVFAQFAEASDDSAEESLERSAPPTSPGVPFAGDASVPAASYVRVNADLQHEDDASRDGQHAEIVRQATARGYTISQRFVFSDQGSGLDSARPGLLALQDTVAKGLVKAVWAYRADRLSRDTLAMLRFFRLCKEHDVEVFFANCSYGGTK